MEIARTDRKSRAINGNIRSYLINGAHCVLTTFKKKS